MYSCLAGFSFTQQCCYLGELRVVSHTSLISLQKGDKILAPKDECSQRRHSNNVQRGDADWCALEGTVGQSRSKLVRKHRRPRRESEQEGQGQRLGGES